MPFYSNGSNEIPKELTKTNNRHSRFVLMLCFGHAVFGIEKRIIFVVTKTQKIHSYKEQSIANEF